MKDYKLSEVKAICESAKDCGGCPLRYDEKHCILEVNMKKWNFDKETDNESNTAFRRRGMRRQYYTAEGYRNIFVFNDRLQELHDRVDGSTLPELLKIRRGLYALKRKYEECGSRYLECESEILAINEVIAEAREQ